MQKSYWVRGSAVVVVAFVMNHAGCYTSGIPGGVVSAAGGVASQNIDASVAAGGASCSAGTGCGGQSSVCSCSDTEVCDLVDNKCYPCVADSDCSSNEYCLLHVCTARVPCSSSAKCNALTPAQVCAPATNAGGAGGGPSTSPITVAGGSISTSTSETSELASGGATSIVSSPGVDGASLGFCVQCLVDSDCTVLRADRCGTNQCVCMQHACTLNKLPLAAEDAGDAGS